MPVAGCLPALEHRFQHRASKKKNDFYCEQILFHFNNDVSVCSRKGRLQAVAAATSSDERKFNKREKEKYTTIVKNKTAFAVKLIIKVAKKSSRKKRRLSAKGFLYCAVRKMNGLL